MHIHVYTIPPPKTCNRLHKITRQTSVHFSCIRCKMIQIKKQSWLKKLKVLLISESIIKKG